MTTKTLLMFAGLLAPLALSEAASAEIHGAQTTVAIPAPTNDKAPVNTTKDPNTGATITRLKRTNQDQPGNEMTAFTLLKDGKTGFFGAMTTELNGQAANNKVQLAIVKFTLTQQTDGSVAAVMDSTNARFATNNNGNERRNANAPTAMTVNGGSVACFKYNYQPNGTNDTVRYIQCVDQTGKTILPQTKAYAKTNDDCSMHQDGEPGVVAKFDATKNDTTIVEWAGCNGNGQDKGWAFVTHVTCDSADAPTTCKFSEEYDVALAQREERSRGSCSVDSTDPSYAVCTWTEGNNQPQRDGIWMAAIALDQGVTGADQQSAILWKKQLAGKSQVDGITTYAQRAIQERVMKYDSTTNSFAPTNQLFVRWGDASGNNNTNDGKGGTYRTQMVGLAQVSRAGYTYVVKPQDLSTTLFNLGGTHLGSTAALFGTTDSPKPGLVFLNGSQNGGGTSSQIRPVSLDTSTGQFTDLGAQEGPSHDRHLYSNYLGNNPGNQGRNHSEMRMVANPYVGQNGNTDALLLLTATSGKRAEDMNDASIKLTAFLSVMGIAQTGTGGGTGGGGGSGGGSGSGSDGSDPGTTLGGCNAANAAGGGLTTFALIGLAAFVRRRRA